MAPDARDGPAGAGTGGLPDVVGGCCASTSSRRWRGCQFRHPASARRGRRRRRQGSHHCRQPRLQCDQVFAARRLDRVGSRRATASRYSTSSTRVPASPGAERERVFDSFYPGRRRGRQGQGLRARARHRPRVRVGARRTDRSARSRRRAARACSFRLLAAAGPGAAARREDRGAADGAAAAGRRTNDHRVAPRRRAMAAVALGGVRCLRVAAAGRSSSRGGAAIPAPAPTALPVPHAGAGEYPPLEPVEPPFTTSAAPAPAPETPPASTAPPATGGPWSCAARWFSRRRCRTRRNRGRGSHRAHPCCSPISSGTAISVRTTCAVKSRR